MPPLERPGIRRSPLKDGPPGEPALRAVQDDKLHEALVVDAGHSPLFVVVPPAPLRAIVARLGVSMASAPHTTVSPARDIAPFHRLRPSKWEYSTQRHTHVATWTARVGLIRRVL